MDSSSLEVLRLTWSNCFLQSPPATSCASVPDRIEVRVDNWVLKSTPSTSRTTVAPLINRYSRRSLCRLFNYKGRKSRCLPLRDFSPLKRRQIKQCAQLAPLSPSLDSVKQRLVNSSSSTLFMHGSTTRQQITGRRRGDNNIQLSIGSFLRGETL